MTKKDWMHLAALPDDIRRRETRLRTLEELQANGPQEASDTVQSSTDAGDATIICHAVIRGTDIAYTQREERIAGMRRVLDRLNAQYRANYITALEEIENEPNPEMRCILNDVLIEGKSFTNAYPQGTTEAAVKMRVYRWVEQHS